MTQTPSRSRFPALLLWVTLGTVLMAGGLWFAPRVRALAVIDRQIRAGMACSWHLPWGLTDSSPAGKYLRLLPGTRLESVDLVFSGKAPEDVAPALRYYRLGKLSIASATPSEMVRFLTAYGRDSTLEDLTIVGLLAPDSLKSSLLRFPNLRRLHLNGSYTSGEDVPMLENLKELNLSYASVTDEGLNHLLTLPELEHLFIQSDAITLHGIQHLAPPKCALKEFWASLRQLSHDETTQAEAALKKTFPRARIVLDNR